MTETPIDEVLSLLRDQKTDLEENKDELIKTCWWAEQYGCENVDCTAERMKKHCIADEVRSK